jgi:hypothetical protein
MTLEAETATAGSSERDVHMTPKSKQRVDAARPKNREREYVRQYAIQYPCVADTMMSTKVKRASVFGSGRRAPGRVECVTTSHQSHDLACYGIFHIVSTSYTCMNDLLAGARRLFHSTTQKEDTERLMMQRQISRAIGSCIVHHASATWQYRRNH